MENNNGKGIFYGVIGVATLVVAIIGATFAYFASATQGNNGAAAANSAKVSGTLEITQDGQYVAPDLIPASPATVLASFGQTGDATANTGKCRGASAANHNGNYGMCSYYTFTVKNTSDVDTQVYLSLTSDTNTFDGADFKYCVYEGTTTTGVAQACKSVPAAKGSEQFTGATGINLAKNGGSKQYTIVLYYENQNSDQTEAGAGKSYTGTVSASTSDGKNQIVGYIAGVQENPGV